MTAFFLIRASAFAAASTMAVGERGVEVPKRRWKMKAILAVVQSIPAGELAKRVRYMYKRMGCNEVRR